MQKDQHTEDSDRAVELEMKLAFRCDGLIKELGKERAVRIMRYAIRGITIALDKLNEQTSEEGR